MCKEFWTEVFRKQARACRAGCSAALYFDVHCSVLLLLKVHSCSDMGCSGCFLLPADV